MKFSRRSPLVLYASGIEGSKEIPGIHNKLDSQLQVTASDEQACPFVMGMGTSVACYNRAWRPGAPGNTHVK